jgi:response regulator of citrate/malate metabolism
VAKFPLSKLTLVIVIEDDPMNPTVKAPIHAATAMLTATVTAMSMIDATTGLRAFAFFLIFLKVFISLSIPPLGLMSMLDDQCHLNLTT